ncbi:conserved hypothetical protein [Microlunatus soli]|uniref:EthD domain-containing protein n=1 Tax=Microlunatus soli TaxID=630515 RepID=A0A1H1YN18_9ACTN|nr:conserved hypothetical protein [Microlunatus soli]
MLYGEPERPEEFDHYYDQTHVPLASKMRGLSRWTITKFEPAPDGTPPPYYYAAELYAETREALEEVLASDEGRAANADVEEFATGGAVYCFGPEVDVPVEGSSR